MKSAIPTLICGLALTHTLSAQSIVNSTNNPNLFGGPGAGSVTVASPAGLLNVNLFGGSTANTQLGTHWNARATGGVNIGAAFISVAASGSQVALTGNSLQFNTQTSGVLGLLGVGTTVSESWSATGTFSNLSLNSGQTYRVSFDVDGTNGLLDSALLLSPSLSVELLDGAGTRIGMAGNTDPISLLGLLGGAESGSFSFDFQAPVGVNTGPASVRFVGSAGLPITAAGIGSNFATFTNLDISAVPEPSALLLGAFGALGLLRRRRN